MTARRCQLDAGQVPAYTPCELHRLVGGVGGASPASLRPETTGLLTWSGTTLTFATSPTDLRGVHNLADFHTMYNAISNRRRRVPVPRQAIRLIAGGCRATVIATMLGHLLRCLYYRDRRCIGGGGWCKHPGLPTSFGSTCAMSKRPETPRLDRLDRDPRHAARPLQPLGALCPHPPLLDPRDHGAGSTGRRPHTRKRITTSSGVLHSRITTPH